MMCGIDLGLAMVEADLGSRIANYVSRVLIADARRGPGEPQFSARVDAQEVELRRLRQVMLWVLDNPSADLSTAALARRANVSVRSLHRHFLAEAGTTPAKYVERARVEAAQRLLTTTDRSLDEVALACGFGTSVSMHRAFARRLGVSPSAYRKLTRRSAHM
jgi:transcriptional regulator GlxA family with amidase domain